MEFLKRNIGILAYAQKVMARTNYLLLEDAALLPTLVRQSCKKLNLKVKYQESFRRFAPSVLREDVSDWFVHETDSPYMLLVAGVKNEKRRQNDQVESALFGIEKLNVPRSTVPTITHVDYSSRIQTVHF